MPVSSAQVSLAIGDLQPILRARALSTATGRQLMQDHAFALPYRALGILIAVRGAASGVCSAAQPTLVITVSSVSVFPRA